MPSTRTTLRTLALGTGLAAALSMTTAPPTYADTTVTVPPTASSVTVQGEGNGHGHGMSQHGANVAARQGASTETILRHYYPGTASGRAAGRIRVLLSRRPTLVVASRPALTAGVVGGRRWRLTHLPQRSARHAKRWRITPVSAARSRLSYRAGGRWRTFRVVTGELQFSAGGAPVRLFAGADSGTFRGTLRAARTAAGGTDRDVVNVLPLEAYVKGVVPNEMPALWAPAAVRAQAVAARTYAVHERATTHRGWFDVYPDTRSQVYRGVSSEQPGSNRAVAATRAQIRTYGGRPAFTQFASSNGGYMLAVAGHPYLVSGRDAYDPVLRWTKTIPMSAFRARFGSTYPLRSITVRTYARAGGWVDVVRLTGTNGKVNEVPGTTFRAWAGLRSGSFRFAS